MSEKIFFEKWHGIGNDFVLLDCRTQNISINHELIVFLGNRHTGIGFDQLILIENSKTEKCDASYRFFNPDGSEAEQCGNGQRCISKYLHIQQPKQKQFCVSGLSGLMYSKIADDGNVKVNMGKVKSLSKVTVEHRKLFHVDFGNPHLVSEHSNIDSCNLEMLHQRYTKDYPKDINLEIVEILSPSEIKLRVYERGTGETLACGSGACAAVYALQSVGLLSSIVKVILPGGNLVVEYNQQTKSLYLTGSATHVFSGEITV